MNVKKQEKWAKAILWGAALVTVGMLFLIIGYIFKEGLA